MAKDFKRYDVMFKKHRGTAIENLRKNAGPLANRLVNFNDIDCWPAKEMALPYVRYYHHSVVQHAVYEAEGFLEWQQFRVSMKGLPTRQRIYALCVRWESFRARTRDDEERRIEMVRINNYIGSLIRAGLIETGTLQVIK